VFLTGYFSYLPIKLHQGTDSNTKSFIVKAPEVAAAWRNGSVSKKSTHLDSNEIPFGCCDRVTTVTMTKTGLATSRSSRVTSSLLKSIALPYSFGKN
jgi:hypothetical protein